MIHHDPTQSENIFSKRPLLVLAPMAGITDLPFRIICKEHGANTVYSEMVSAAGLMHNKAKNLEYVKSHRQDRPLIVQLFGNDPCSFAKATQTIDNLPKRNKTASIPAPRRPEGLDINFGCPVKKVLKQGAGCELMKKPRLVREIIKAVLDNTSLPVSIKIRAGINGIDARKFVELIADLQWSTIIVHGRTFKNGFTGPINCKLIKDIKQKHPHKTVIANGGIFSPQEAKNVLDKTEADGIAIARGALGNPWIFQQIKSYLKSGHYFEPELDQIKKTVLHHVELAASLDKNYNFLEFRKHLSWYFKGVPGAKSLRRKLFEISSLEQIKKILKQL